ncbi:hypothetical protein ACG873_01690 (plasmid) [Mesorhizobium sp. AaZ16]|uniref:hypothetical protein n=1 Tax=Mesorhizobium sp. AaZ16 TaxID=3402289 RepID=UPI00374ED99E
MKVSPAGYRHGKPENTIAKNGTEPVDINDEMAELSDNVADDAEAGEEIVEAAE